MVIPLAIMKHPSPKSSCFQASTACMLLLVFCATGVTHQGLAQAKNTKVTIKAMELRSNRGSDGEENFEYRCNNWFNGTKNSNCINFSNVKPNKWHTVSAGDQLRVNNGLVADMQAALQFHSEFWEEDGCDGNCSYDYGCGGSDEAHCGKRLPEDDMILYNMVPGNFNGYPNLKTYLFCGDSYQIKYLLNFAPPQPDRPTVKVNGIKLTDNMSVTDTNCNDPMIDLTSNIYLQQSSTILGHVEYAWEYRIGSQTYVQYVPNPEYCGEFTDCTGGGGTDISLKVGAPKVGPDDPDLPPPPCCDEPPYLPVTQELWNNVPGGTINAWTQLSTGNGKKFSLRALPGLENIAQNTRVTFRVIARANGMSSVVSQTSLQVALSPESPKANPLNITKTPSCPLEATGTVTITGITSQFADYKYIMRAGIIAEFGGCNPNSGSCFPATDKVGSNSGSTLVISQVMPGPYTLFLLNSGGNDGFCPRRIGDFTVGEVSKLIVNENPVVPEDAACHGVNTGRITVSISAGRPDNVSYQLTHATSGSIQTKTSTTANASTTFDALAVGNYSLSVSDGCTPSVPRSFTIRQPKKVSSTSFSTVNATCSNPGNGAVAITVARSSGTFDREVSSQLHYRLFKGETLYHQQTQAGLSIAWTDLQAGDYKLIVTENGSAECNGVVQSFTISAPLPLGVDQLTTTHVSCYDGNTGTITVKGKGGTGAYTYSLVLSGETIPANTTGIFTGLKAGDYQLIIKNQLTCNDSYSQSPVHIDQPEKLEIVITGTDITCHNVNDGKITSVVTGGTPGFTYAWQYLNGATWQSLGSTGSAISGLEADRYRVTVTDSKSCQVISNEVTIANPPELNISSIGITDIKCFGDKGSITPVITGGTSPYTWLYAVGSSSYSTFTASTLFNAGSYKIKVKDKNGCEFLYGNEIVITTPSASLNFTAQLSDYSGFNISCYGGSNGTATLTATGGNGGSYSGYQYAVDGGAFTSNPFLQNMAAGVHSFTVKDARGCIISKNITFTQTSVILAVQLVEQVNVACFGDKSGELKVTGSGGVAPYEYRINEQAFQTTTHFTQLEFGDYTVTIKDKNGCTNTASYTILSVNPLIEIDTEVTHVKCFGGNDGTIEAIVSGGVSPFSYQWQNGSVVDNIQNLKQGSYTVNVTDAAGCKSSASITIEQPLQPLNLQLVTVPVCYGRTNGFVTAQAEGGTAPYEYSIDNGLNFQNPTQFEKPAGSYEIVTRDAHGCIDSAPAQITIRNNRPEPNFLAATSRNAQDVIAIVDISVPKPDSIVWVFDPAAIIIDDNPLSPAVKFMEPGTYMVNMTGYFEGCDYTTIKSITVNPFDPNAAQEALPGYQAIQSLSVSPNPSSGEFDINLKLNGKYRVSVMIYDVLGVERYTHNWADVVELNETIAITNATTGVYMMRVVTEKDARDVRIIINK